MRYYSIDYTKNLSMKFLTPRLQALFFIARTTTCDIKRARIYSRIARCCVGK